MACDYYSVWYGNVMIADHMFLDDALLLVKALFEKYWDDPSVFYTIKKNAGEVDLEE